MNPSSPSETEVLQTDIKETRRRMDDTMDALGERFQPRHLMDEVIGFFRRDTNGGENRLVHLRDKVVHSCDSAMHAVVDGVKKNPVPALVIGAGVAWMIYESRREKKPRRSGIGDYSRDRGEFGPDRDGYYGSRFEYSASTRDEPEFRAAGSSQFEGLKDQVAGKASSAMEKVKDTVEHVGEAAREKMGALRDRAADVTSHLRHGAHDAFVRTREGVVRTADQRPLEVGLIVLAAGLIAGLALPTPNVVNRAVGPTADKLRARTRQAGEEMLDKGRRVAEAAVISVKSEAEAQGLTPGQLQSKVETIAERAKDSAREAAENEGLRAPSQSAPPPQSDPSNARPVV